MRSARDASALPDGGAAHADEGAACAETPRIMIAAPHGRSGKTVLTLGLLRALRRRGAAVQPFKKGADFIDPGWHSVAAGRVSRNLDRYFMTPDQIREVLLEQAAGSDVCVIEGAMGLYDGMDAQGSTSSAEIAKITETPVVLVLDVTRMTRTAAAIVMGCCLFDREVNIVGVILNKVRGRRQRDLITEAIEGSCGIPVIGSVPKDVRMDVPDRHLGLVTCGESSAHDDLLDGIAAVVEQYVDVDAIQAIACTAMPLPRVERGGWVSDASCAVADDKVTIAVMRDEVFSFYYPENLEALEREGAHLSYVNSLADCALPQDACGLYVGGGFPEEFAARLQANTGLRESVRECARRGLPVYAECGGLMYLGRKLRCGGECYDMVGALAFDTVMQEKQVAHGYARCVVTEPCSWLPQGSQLKGHEHHHSQVVELDPSLRFACRTERGHGIAEHRDGLCQRGIVAGYLHVNAIASPVWAPSFASAARRYRASAT